MAENSKKISILGSTGSIGGNSLKIISENKDSFSVVGLCAGRNIKLLAKQVLKFRPKLVSIQYKKDIGRFTSMLSTKLSKNQMPKIYSGEEGAVKISTIPEADIVLSAIVGAAALRPTYEAVRAGKKVALANKESIVMAGRIMMEEAKRSGATIMPVDSEHSAIFQSMLGHNRSEISRLILTASGGPFVKKNVDFLKKVKPAHALKHPNWKMGAKITIDSATLMNKALEIIEARWLFDIEPEKISVMIHPQSIIHSIVEYRDGSMISQMGMPDMRVPISYALAYPHRVSTNHTFLNLEQVKKLTFSKPRYKVFPTIKYAYEALKKGDSMCVVLNAANEASVKAFICGTIRFLDIQNVIGKALSQHKAFRLKTIDEAIEIHEKYTKVTNEIMEGLKDYHA